MKRVVFLLVGLMLVAGGLFVVLRRDDRQPITVPAESQPEGPVIATVRMTTDKYQPNEITIRAGETVRFVNESDKPLWPASNIHPTHELYSEFDPKRALQPGESWMFTFRRSGMWRMHDHLLPYIKGSVTVE